MCVQPTMYVCAVCAVCVQCLYNRTSIIQHEIEQLVHNAAATHTYILRSVQCFSMLVGNDYATWD